MERSDPQESRLSDCILGDSSRHYNFLYTFFRCPFQIAKKLFALPSQREFFVQQVRCGSLGWGMSAMWALSLVNVWSYYIRTRSVVWFIFPHYIQFSVVTVLPSPSLSSLPRLKHFTIKYWRDICCSLWSVCSIKVTCHTQRRFREWFFICF